MNEFNTIEKYFLPLTEHKKEALALKDDGACLNTPDGCTLVTTTDTLNVGTHIFETSSPADLAHKAIRTNLSDLAAMGATPYAYQLSLSFPKKPSQKWLSAFTSALLEDQKKYGIFCSGGDTTSSLGVLSVSITAFGLAKKNTVLKRSTAKINDQIILSGPIGDAYIGYKILKNAFKTNNDPYFIDAYHRPEPRLKLIQNIKDKVNAAIDISDGLAADLMHIARTSNLSASLTLDERMFSASAHEVLKEEKVTIEELLTGGDDYELILSIPKEHTELMDKKHPELIKIGYFTTGNPALHITDQDGKAISLAKHGWTHF